MVSNARRLPQLLNPTSVRVFFPALIVLLLAPSIGCLAAEKVTTHWASQPVQVDGDGSDWENYPIKFFRDQEISIGLANDSTNIYVLMRFRDPQWMRTIRMTGLNLYFDNKGGKKKRFTLTYRGGPDPSQLREIDTLGMSQRGMEMPDEMKGRMEEKMRERQGREFVCAIDGEIFDKAIPTDGSEGPSAASGYEAGFFTYEFRVPLQEHVVRFYGINAPPGKKIGIGLVWGDMSELKQNMREDGPRGGRMGGGTPGGMGGGPPGGGMGGPPGGGMGGPPGGGERSLPEKQEIWIKTQLSNGAASEAKE